MTFIVTGASGFLGAALVRRLARAHRVVALSRKPAPAEFAREVGRVNWRRGDLHDCAFLRRVLEPGSVVVHLAGLKGASTCAADVARAIDGNVIATRVLTEASRAAGVRRILFASSYWVYGRRWPAELPCSEDDELRPVDVYGMSKAIAEQLIAQSGIDFLTLRLSNIFGISVLEINHDVVFHMVDSALRRSVVEVVGTGDHTMDLLDVDVACSYLQRLGELASLASGVVNVGSGHPVTIVEVANLVIKVCSEIAGRPIAVRHRAAEGSHPFSKAMSIDRLRRLLGSIDESTLEEQLGRFTREFADTVVR